jgi:hypothetical protein
MFNGVNLVEHFPLKENQSLSKYCSELVDFMFTAEELRNGNLSSFKDLDSQSNVIRVRKNSRMPLEKLRQQFIMSKKTTIYFFIVSTRLSIFCFISFSKKKQLQQNFTSIQLSI